MSTYRLQKHPDYPSTVEAWSSATPFHSQHWCELIEHSLGIRTEHSVLLSDDTVIAYLPYYHGGVFVKKLRSGPALANYCPALLFDDVRRLDTGNLHALISERHSNALLPSSANEKSSTSIFNLHIDGDFDTYWETQVHSKAKYDVRKADKHDITTQFMDSSGYEFFYPLYLKRMRELGSPALPGDFFIQLANSFKDSFNFAVSFKGDRAVAASTLLGYQGRWIGHPWSVSDSDFRHISVNYAHYRDLIRHAFVNNYTNFYLGTSLKDSNWSRIKKRFGANELFAVRVDGRPNQHAANSPMVKTAQFVLKHLPAPIYRQVSPSISKIAIKLLD